MTIALAPIASSADLVGITEMLDSARSDATKRAYATAHAAWLAYCDEHGNVSAPESEQQQAEFLVHVLAFIKTMRDSGKATSTISKTLSGIKWVTRRNPWAQFVLGSSPVSEAMQSTTRANKGRAVRKARELTLADFAAAHRALIESDSVTDIRNRAILAVGVGGALRAQSIADLRLSDVTPSSQGYRVRLRHSKTDQTGAGRDLWITRATNTIIDPVRAITEWLDLLSKTGITADSSPEHPLFPRMRRGDVITSDVIGSADLTLTNLVRALVVRAGITTEAGSAAYSSHSLRATFVTLSFAAGVPEHRIAFVTGHKNLNVLRGYDRTSGELQAQVDYLGG